MIPPVADDGGLEEAISEARSAEAEQRAEDARRWAERREAASRLALAARSFADRARQTGLPRTELHFRKNEPRPRPPIPAAPGPRASWSERRQWKREAERIRSLPETTSVHYAVSAWTIQDYVATTGYNKEQDGLWVTDDGRMFFQNGLDQGARIIPWDELRSRDSPAFVDQVIRLMGERLAR
jgi:hypothetical protein